MSKAKTLAELVSTGSIFADGVVSAAEVTGLGTLATLNDASLTTDVTGTLPIANGGTNATTAEGARTSLSAASSGANSDITSLAGLTTALSVAQGGTGLTTVGVAGRVLTSDGTNLVYTEPAGGAQAFVTMFNGGNTTPTQNSDGFGII
jgi:hypothetical protein